MTHQFEEVQPTPTSALMPAPGPLQERAPVVQPPGRQPGLGIDTQVLMADGTSRPIREVAAGVAVLGPDGRARRVVSTAAGSELLYRVTPKKGESYIAAAGQALALRKTPGGDGLKLPDGSHVPKKADMVGVEVGTLLASNATVRHCLKGWRADAVTSFDRPDDQWACLRLLPPYQFGAWLGDGTRGQAQVTKPRCQLVDKWIEMGESIGYWIRVSESGGGCPTWSLTQGYSGLSLNVILLALKEMGVAERKHIPVAYLYAPIAVRLELLAGLIDSDGSVSNGCCDWISVSEELARGFAFLCRSVGLSCYLSYQRKGIKSTGFEGWYWRASVSGDLSIIPTLDKPFPARLQKKRHLVHGITLEPVGVGDCCSIEVDGDHQFLLEDFTVVRGDAASCTHRHAEPRADQRRHT